MSKKDIPQLLTTQQVASMLGISRQTLYRVRDQIGIPQLRVGGSVRFPEAEVKRWISEKVAERSKG